MFFGSFACLLNLAFLPKTMVTDPSANGKKIIHEKPVYVEREDMMKKKYKTIPSQLEKKRIGEYNEKYRKSLYSDIRRDGCSNH